MVKYLNHLKGTCPYGPTLSLFVTLVNAQSSEYCKSIYIMQCADLSHRLQIWMKPMRISSKVYIYILMLLRIIGIMIINFEC